MRLGVRICGGRANAAENRLVSSKQRVRELSRLFTLKELGLESSFVTEIAFRWVAL